MTDEELIRAQRDEARKRAEFLIADVHATISVITDIAKQHGLEGLQISIGGTSVTYHTTRSRWGAEHFLSQPDWYDDEFWESSAADCSLGLEDVED